MVNVIVGESCVAAEFTKEKLKKKTRNGNVAFRPPKKSDDEFLDPESEIERIPGVFVHDPRLLVAVSKSRTYSPSLSPDVAFRAASAV